MKINYTTKQIEITKKEANEASKYGSETYKELVQIKNDFPEFVVAVREISLKGRNKGLSYDKMELYVNSNGTEDQKAQLESMRKAAKDGLVSNGRAYKVIKEWFNKNFPEASNFTVAMERITKKSEDANEENDVNSEYSEKKAS